MLKPRTLRILALMLVGVGLLALLAIPFPDSGAGLVVAGPLLTVYALNMLGMPGLLEHDGACGWGWCPPTVLGWCLSVGIWLFAAWLVAWGIASLTERPANG